MTDPVRRGITLLPMALGCVAWGSATWARAATLPAARSLAAELVTALRAGHPLVVMASLDGCPFCRMVRDNYLAPLQREMALPVVQLDMASGERVAGFDGAQRSHEQILRAWDIKVAPTVLFFGEGGREVAPRLAGASIPDFYGAYLDERLRVARRAIARKP